jgi:hypothetical protein
MEVGFGVLYSAVATGRVVMGVLGMIMCVGCGYRVVLEDLFGETHRFLTEHHY